MGRINKRITSRYSRALLDVAVEKGLSEVLSHDMMLLEEVLTSSPDLCKLLRNQIIKNFRKKKIMSAIFEAKVNSLSMTFINLIIDKSHEGILLPIVLEFNECYKEYMGIKTANIETSLALTDTLRHNIKEQLAEFTGKKIDLVERLDAKVIGGYRIRIGDFRYDCTLEEKFKQLSKDFERNIYEKAF